MITPSLRQYRVSAEERMNSRTDDRILIGGPSAISSQKTDDYNQDIEESLGKYIGRPVEQKQPPFQASSNLAKPLGKTPLFEEFESLRQEMLADSRNNRINKWREESRSRGRTREREDLARARQQFDDEKQESQRAKRLYPIQEGHTKRDMAAQKADLLDQLMLDELEQVDGTLTGKTDPPPLSYHHIKDQVAYLNKVGLMIMPDHAELFYSGDGGFQISDRIEDTTRQQAKLIQSYCPL
jgi:hypothetical protein